MCMSAEIKTKTVIEWGTSIQIARHKSLVITHKHLVMIYLGLSLLYALFELGIIGLTLICIIYLIRKQLTIAVENNTGVE